MADIRPPSRVSTLQQLISYLYQLSEELNLALAGQGGSADSASSSSVAQPVREINRQAEVLRALVKRTAAQVEAGYTDADEALRVLLDGEIDALDGRVDALETLVQPLRVTVGNFELRVNNGGGFEFVLAG